MAEKYNPLSERVKVSSNKVQTTNQHPGNYQQYPLQNYNKESYNKKYNSSDKKLALKTSISAQNINTGSQKKLTTVSTNNLQTYGNNKHPYFNFGSSTSPNQAKIKEKNLHNESHNRLSYEIMDSRRIRTNQDNSPKNNVSLDLSNNLKGSNRIVKTTISQDKVVYDQSRVLNNERQNNTNIYDYILRNTPGQYQQQTSINRSNISKHSNNSGYLNNTSNSKIVKTRIVKLQDSPDSNNLFKTYDYIYPEKNKQKNTKTGYSNFNGQNSNQTNSYEISFDQLKKNIDLQNDKNDDGTIYRKKQNENILFRESNLKMVSKNKPIVKKLNNLIQNQFEDSGAVTERNNQSIYIQYEPEVRISQNSNNNNEISQVQTERPSKRAVEQNEIKTERLTVTRKIERSHDKNNQMDEIQNKKFESGNNSEKYIIPHNEQNEKNQPEKKKILNDDAIRKFKAYTTHMYKKRKQDTQDSPHSNQQNNDNTHTAISDQKIFIKEKQNHTDQRDTANSGQKVVDNNEIKTIFQETFGQFKSKLENSDVELSKIFTEKIKDNNLVTSEIFVQNKEEIKGFDESNLELTISGDVIRQRQFSYEFLSPKENTFSSPKRNTFLSPQNADNTMLKCDSNNYSIRQMESKEALLKYIESEPNSKKHIETSPINPQKKDQNVQCRIAEDLYELLENKLEIYNRVKERDIIGNLQEKQRYQEEYEIALFEKNEIIAQYESKISFLTNKQNSVNNLSKIDENVEFISELEQKLRDLSNENQNQKNKVNELNIQVDYYKPKADEATQLKKELHRKELDMQQLEYKYKKLEQKLRVYDTVTNKSVQQSNLLHTEQSFENCKQSGFNQFLSNVKYDYHGEIFLDEIMRKSSVNSQELRSRLMSGQSEFKTKKSSGQKERHLRKTNTQYEVETKINTNSVNEKAMINLSMDKDLDLKSRTQSLNNDKMPKSNFAFKFPNISNIINIEGNAYDKFGEIYHEINETKRKPSDSQNDEQVIKLKQVEDFQQVLQKKVDDFETQKKIFLTTPEKKNKKLLDKNDNKPWMDFKYDIMQLSKLEKQELRNLLEEVNNDPKTQLESVITVSDTQITSPHSTQIKQNSSEETSNKDNQKSFLEIKAMLQKGLMQSNQKIVGEELDKTNNKSKSDVINTKNQEIIDMLKTLKDWLSFEEFKYDND